MAEIRDLSRYVSLVKNVRGIAVYDPENPPEREFFTWLSRRHQYRNVGIPEGLEHPSVDLDGYKTFERLEPPLEGSAELVESMETVENWVARSLVLGSAYAAPLFVHPGALEAFDPAATWKLETSEDLETDQVLRHMRIAGYGTVDFLEETAIGARNAIQDDAVDSALARRASMAIEDGEERFWRLLEDDESGTTQWVGGYFDPLSVLGASARKRVAKDSGLSVCLGLLGGFLVLRE